ncbi:hypothetical protein ACWGI8_41710 [Streptomyces sp. NPDC054841]
MPECYAGTYYPHLREVLDSRYAGFSDGELEEAFAEASAENITPAEYEEFFDGLGNALAKVAEPAGTFARAVGPGALRGAAAGSALGPFGALGGALVGAAGSALQRYGGHVGRGSGGVVGGAISTAGSPAGPGAPASGLLGTAGPAAGSGGPASAALTALLQRPEVARALAALSGGHNALIPVGRLQVPVAAHTFARLLGALAQEAEAEWTTDAESEEEPTAGDERAGRLLGLLVGAERDEAESDDAAIAAYEESGGYGGYGAYDVYDGFDDHEGLDDDEDFDDIDIDIDDALTDDECFAVEFDELVGVR